MSTSEIRFSQSELAKLRKKAYKFLDARRVPHVAGCEKEAEKLALRWGENPEAACAAAILHDATKRLSYKEQRKLIEKYEISCDEELLASPKLLHAVTGAALAEKEFHMPAEICSAIRWHTTGKPGMVLLEKIIYMADYIEPTRCFEGVEDLRTVAYEDLDAALGKGLGMSMEEVRSYGTEPYYITKEAYHYYLDYYLNYQKKIETEKR